MKCSHESNLYLDAWLFEGLTQTALSHKEGLRIDNDGMMGPFSKYDSYFNKAFDRIILYLNKFLFSV
jgi:hypothetical protein